MIHELTDPYIFLFYVCKLLCDFDVCSEEAYIGRDDGGDVSLQRWWDEDANGQWQVRKVHTRAS